MKFLVIEAYDKTKFCWKTYEQYLESDRLVVNDRYVEKKSESEYTGLILFTN